MYSYCNLIKKIQMNKQTLLYSIEESRDFHGISMATEMAKVMTVEKRKGYMMILSAGIMWGTMGLFTNALGEWGLSSSLIAFMRLGTGVILLGILMLITKGPSVFRIDWKGFLWCVLLGVSAQALFNISYIRAISEAGMAVAASLLYTSPIFVCVMSKLFFRERIGRKKLTALLVNVAGCAVAVTGGSFGSLQIPAAGLAAGLAAGFFYGTLTIIGTAALKYHDPLTVLFYGMLTGSLLLGAVSSPWEVLPQKADLNMLLITAGYALVPTCLAYAVYMVGLSKNLEASRVPVLCSVEIVSAALIGTVVLGQEMTAGKLAGILIILFSIVMMNMRFHRCYKGAALLSPGWIRNRI